MSTLRRITSFALAVVTTASMYGQYSGTGSITQGAGTVVVKDLYVCAKGRPTNTGTIQSRDGKTWALPAAVNFANTEFPKSFDLHNACTGTTYANTTAARTALASVAPVVVDQDGEIINAFVFADNYFEMYVNGKPVGKDNVPFTQFNSSVVRFRAKRPCTIALLCVDWEENLGLGSETQPGTSYHPGDGGIVVTFMDNDGVILATTSKSWKAQTYYTSPVQDLSCLQETGSTRSSASCSTADAADGSKFYGVHWERPANWTSPSFDDSGWPMAVEYANNEVGVDNKPAFTNFLDVFDNPVQNAQFIWSSNLILDNEILMRYTLPGTTSVSDDDKTQIIAPNPAGDVARILLPREEIESIDMFDATGLQVATDIRPDGTMDLTSLPSGSYVVRIKTTSALHHVQVVHR
jgi:hypothetical protein